MKRAPYSLLAIPYSLVGCLLLGLLGCLHSSQRMQSDDEAERDKDLELKTVGDVTDVGNAQPVQVWGVGLVTGLEGTGGRANPDGFRTRLENDLLKRRYEHVKELLDSPNTSLVLVAAWLPAGVRKGDPIDVEVMLPPQSKTTSLQGGYLQECWLYDGSTTKTIDPKIADGANRYLQGHPLAWAKGPLLVGFGEGDDAARLRQGRIWGGGHAKTGRPYYLLLKNDEQRAPVAKHVADRVNETLQGKFHGSLAQLAVASDNKAIGLSVPEQYKLNQPRFLRVVRLVPMAERPESLARYRHRLSELLLDPKKTVSAALRLEALGTDSIDVLKEGLQSEHVLVRFCAAEALAYLGSPSCGEELARAAQQQPALRSYALTALASLDEAVSHVKLRELLSSNSAEARYGAFRALRALDEREPSVRGEEFNESFWVHRVAAQATPLVHVSSSRRAEVVLFGDDITLRPPFSFLAGEFTLTAARDDDQCTVSRVSVRRGVQRRQCPLALYDVVRTLGEMGGEYPQVVEFLRQANVCQSISCAMAVDALPQATSVYYLAKHGADDPDFQKGDDEEIRNARTEFLATPTLFDKSGGRRPSMIRRADAGEGKGAGSD